MMQERPGPFAEWLRATMDRRGLSQAELARAVGVADAQVSRWRRGRVTPSLRYLQRLADTFGVPRAQLDRMAGYPSPEVEGVIDPALEAELQAYQARFAQLLAEKLPRRLWPTYLEACAALADSLGAAFQEAQERAEEEMRRGERRPMGFRTEE